MLERLLDKGFAPIVLILLFVTYLIISLYQRIIEDRQIQALGARAPRFRTYVPFGISFILSAIRHARRRESLEFSQKLFAAYGNANNPYTVEANAGGQRIIWTADPENIKAILATQFHEYGKGARLNADFHDFLGDSIFTTDQERWHESRQLIRPIFIKDRVSDLHIFESHVNSLIPRLGGRGEIVDITNLFLRYTLDVATDFLLGRSVESLQNPQIVFAEAFQEVLRVQNIIVNAGPLMVFVSKRSFYEGLKTINDFIEPFIEQTLSLSPSELESKSKSDEGYTFLHALASFTRDRKVLRDQLVAVLLAGRDSTAYTLSWLFYELSCHPQVVQNLRHEICEVVGLQRPPTYANLKSMKYLQNTLNETLRLYPAVPFNVRVALEDTSLPHGGGPDGNQPIGILKDTPIGYSTLAMQRRPDIYPQPVDEKGIESSFPPVLEFVPERWKMWTPKSWTYIPFNGGPRICVGQQFALTEMGYTVVRLLQRFARIETRMGGQKPAMKSEIVLSPEPGIRVAFLENEENLNT